MAVQKLTIEQFVQLTAVHPVFDVRSPGEYLHAHIPGAISLPLFTDEERKLVGTTYKQQSREAAIKIGLDYFGPKMRKMVEEVEILVEAGNTPGKKAVLVHCWRGGMRSAGVAWLLDLYGFQVYTLAGGYKDYRNWVRKQFEPDYPFIVIGGYTGSGKTRIIRELKHRGKNILDLEGLAHHKGSAFGGIGEGAQPSQEMFENELAAALYDLHTGHVTSKQPDNHQSGEQPPLTGTSIYLEDESQRIGQLNIPAPLWKQMRKSPVNFLDVPFEERLNYITDQYGSFEKEALINSILRIQKRLGGLETKNAVSHLLENNHKECFRVLLSYYDKWYLKGLLNRDKDSRVNKIPCDIIDISSMTKALINENATAV